MTNYCSNGFKFLLILFIFFSVSCIPKKINQELTTEQKFIESSIRTWRSIDIAADAIYSVFGELYKHDMISEEQKDLLIKVGTPLSSGLSITKESIETYLLLMHMNEDVDSAHQKVISSLILIVHLFHNVKDELETIYKITTGKSIEIPNIVLFPELKQELILEDK